MAMISAMRMLNALENGTITGAQLQTLLVNNSRRGELQVLLEIPGQVRRITANNVTMTAVAASSTAMNAVIASSTAMTAVIASSTAMTAVAASSVAMNAVIASSTAMTAVIASSTAMAAVAASSVAMTAVAASSTAMTAVAASSTAKMSIFNSDTALAAIAASSTALTTMRAAPQYALSAGTLGAIAGLNAAGSYIVVGLSTVNGTSAGVNIATRRAGSAVSMFQSAASGVLASNGLTYPVAMPMVTPFSVANTGPGWTWFVGTLRCDI